MLRAFRRKAFARTHISPPAARRRVRSGSVGYLLVFVVALLVGIGVFFATLRGAPALVGFGEPPPGGQGQAMPDSGSGPGPGYVPVSAESHDWQARMTGVLGLVVSVTVAAIALAISLYAFGALIARLLGSAGGGDSPPA